MLKNQDNYYKDNIIKKILFIDLDGIVYTSSGVGVFRKQTWLNSASRPAHTNGDKIDGTTLLQSLTTAIEYKRVGNLLIIESQEEVSVESLNLKGQSKSLYLGNPKGRIIVDISLVPRGHLVQIQSATQDTHFLR